MRTPNRKLAQESWVRFVAVGLCGVLTNLAWLDERAFPATWLGLTVWILLTVGLPPHLAFRDWLWGGLVGLAVAYHWLPAMAATHLEVSRSTGCLVALFAVTWDAFRFGVFGYIVAALQPSRTQNILLWPVVWVALEWIWPHVFPWRLGHTQIGWLSLCQISEVTGVYGVSFLLMWSAASSAALIQRVRTRRRQRTAAIALCGLAVAGCLTWGNWRARQIDGEDERCSRLHVALVQPGTLENACELLPERSRRVERADLIVWGESSANQHASTAVQSSDTPMRKNSSKPSVQHSSVCPDLGMPLLFGGVSAAPDRQACRNTAFLLDSNAQVLGQYHKRVLMPWGEYAVGQQWIPGLSRLLGERQPLVAGTSPAPLTLPGGARLGVLICYEDLRPDTVRDTVQDGAQLLVNLNNLTSFGRSQALDQHQQIARFRAIETRRCLIRCGITGLTSVVTASGRVSRQAPPHSPATIEATIPLRNTSTFYTRRGDILPLACLVCWGVLAVRGPRDRWTDNAVSE